MTSSDDQSDETEIRFQEAHGARLFRQGKPRAILEVKSPRAFEPSVTPAIPLPSAGTRPNWSRTRTLLGVLGI